MRCAQATRKEVGKNRTLWMGLEGGGVKPCGVADVLVSFEGVDLTIASGEIWFSRCVLFCVWGSSVCDIKVWVVQLKDYSCYGRTFVFGCGSVGSVEPLLERKQGLVYH